MQSHHHPPHQPITTHLVIVLDNSKILFCHCRFAVHLKKIIIIATYWWHCGNYHTCSVSKTACSVKHSFTLLCFSIKQWISPTIPLNPSAVNEKKQVLSQRKFWKRLLFLLFQPEKINHENCYVNVYFCWKVEEDCKKHLFCSGGQCIVCMQI